MVSQKDAVVDLVKQKLGSNYNAAEPCRDKLSKADLEEIRQKVVDGINGGSIKYDKNLDAKGLSRYVMGMITNHLRKAKELNGGKKRSEIEPVRKKADAASLPEDLADAAGE